MCSRYPRRLTLKEVIVALALLVPARLLLLATAVLSGGCLSRPSYDEKSLLNRLEGTEFRKQDDMYVSTLYLLKGGRYVKIYCLLNSPPGPKPIVYGIEHGTYQLIDGVKLKLNVTKEIDPRAFDVLPSGSTGTTYTVEVGEQGVELR